MALSTYSRCAVPGDHDDAISREPALVVTVEAHLWEVREGGSVLAWAETREAILLEAAALSRRRENCPVIVLH